MSALFLFFSLSFNSFSGGGRWGWRDAGGEARPWIWSAGWRWQQGKQRRYKGLMDDGRGNILYVAVVLPITANKKRPVLYPPVSFFPRLLTCCWSNCHETRPLVCVTPSASQWVYQMEDGGRLRRGLRRVQHISSMACGGQHWLKTCHLTPGHTSKLRGKEKCVCGCLCGWFVWQNKEKKELEWVNTQHVMDTQIDRHIQMHTHKHNSVLNVTQTHT